MRMTIGFCTKHSTNRVIATVFFRKKCVPLSYPVPGNLFQMLPVLGRAHARLAPEEMTEIKFVGKTELRRYVLH